MDHGLRNALAGVSAALIGVGLLLGLIQATVAGPSGKTLSCGSPWFVNTAEIRRAENSEDSVTSRGTRVPGATDWRSRCEDAFAGRGTWAAALAGLGALGLLGVGLIGLQASATPTGREHGRTHPD